MMFTDFGLLDRATADVRRVRAGETIFSRGDAGEELELVDSGPRSASAIAETDCVVVPVSEFMIGEAPYFALSVMRVLVERLRYTNESMPEG